MKSQIHEFLIGINRVMSKTNSKILNAIVALAALVTVSSCHHELDPVVRICNETTVGVNTTDQGDDIDGLCDGTISCTVRKAIYTANHSCVAKTIILGTGTKYTITTHETGHDASSSISTLGYMAFPPITGEVIIEGNGAIIERDTTVSDQFRLFHIKSGGKLTLRNVTIQGGQAGAFGSPSTNDETHGGAILNEGELVLENATFIHNQAYDQGGAIFNKGTLTANNSTFKYNDGQGIGGTGYSTGGAVFSSGINTIEGCYFFHNTVGEGEGGALAFESAFTVTSCLFEENRAVHGGFALFADAAGSITNCTFYNNVSAGQDNGVIAAVGTITLDISFCTFSHNISGGQFGECFYLTTPTSAHVSNCIFDANVPKNLYNEPSITYSGTNISSDNSVTTISNPNTNALLGPLEMHGGHTKTMVPMTGSPAIDVVTSVGSVTTDQRGNVRPIDGDGNGTAIGDAGAVEANH